MKILKIIGKALGLGLLAFIAFIVYSWNASANEIKSLCSSFNAGQSIKEVTTTVEKSSYSRYFDTAIENKTTISISSSANMGRHNCWVEYKDGKVVSSKYFFLD